MFAGVVARWFAPSRAPTTRGVWIPKDRFDEVNEERKNACADLAAARRRIDVLESESAYLAFLLRPGAASRRITERLTEAERQAIVDAEDGEPTTVDLSKGDR